MASILRISEAASIAFHAVGFLAQDPSEVSTTAEVALSLGVSEAHLSKVLQRLTKAGYVESVRGPKGGFRIARGGLEGTLRGVYEAIEGPLAECTCLLSRPVCGNNCILGGLLDDVESLVRRKLAGTRISELTKSFGGTRK